MGFIQENAFEYAILKLVAIFSQPESANIEVYGCKYVLMKFVLIDSCNG